MSKLLTTLTISKHAHLNDKKTRTKAVVWHVIFKLPGGGKTILNYSFVRSYTVVVSGFISWSSYFITDATNISCKGK